MLPLALMAAAAALTSAPAAALLYPHDIQGPGFISPYANQTVTDVQGVVVSLSNTGVYISTPASKWDDDPRTSEGLFVFTSSRPNATVYPVGALINIGSSRVVEYVPARGQLSQTELTTIRNVTVVEADASAEIRVLTLGVDSSPPTEYVAIERAFDLPANQVNIEQARANALEIGKYGADYYESLENMQVRLVAPRVVAPITSFGEVQVVPGGGVAVTGTNAHGGITLTRKANGTWDTNPEGINIDNPTTGNHPETLVMGQVLDDITGIVGFSFGLPILVPPTPVTVVKDISTQAPPTTLVSNGTCNGLTIATYNVENLDNKEQDRIALLGQHIDDLLLNPALLGLNEVQDNDGAVKSGNSFANETIASIVAAIKKAPYAAANIDPVPEQNGGEPGGNIRPVFLWRTDILAKYGDAPAGNATSATAVSAVNGIATLSQNPGLIDPTNSAFRNSRKPLAMQFRTRTGSKPFTVIVTHGTSKGGSGPLYGALQPSENGGVSSRTAQNTVIRDFLRQIYAAQPTHKVVVMGDLNEFSDVQPLEVFTNSEPVAGTGPGGSAAPVLKEVVVKDPVERYSYVFQQNSQELDHILITPNRAALSKVEVVHVNTWATRDNRLSDHDPVIMQSNLCL